MILSSLVWTLINFAQKFWGLALPIWEFEDDSFYVVGSKEELKQLAVEGWKDFEGNSPHRPWIDKVKIKFD